MTIISWHKQEVPLGVPVKKVYGICFTNDGRVLLRIENGNFKLIGGRPDKQDRNFFDTLKREFVEDVNTIIENPIYVGYQLIDEENGAQKYAQIRMTALIKEFRAELPDLDKKENWVYGRFLTTPKKAISLLNWGEVGKNQINDAFNIAKKCFKFEKINEEDCLINEEFRGWL